MGVVFPPVFPLKIRSPLGFLGDFGRVLYQYGEYLDGGLQSGEQICDDAATRILECHPNGAAWVILDHCAETQVCLDATCVGEVPTSTASDATGDRDSDAGADAEPTEEDAQSEGDSEQVSPEESESPEDPEE